MYANSASSYFCLFYHESISLLPVLSHQCSFLPFKRSIVLIASRCLHPTTTNHLLYVDLDLAHPAPLLATHHLQYPLFPFQQGPTPASTSFLLGFNAFLQVLNLGLIITGFLLFTQNNTLFFKSKRIFMCANQQYRLELRVF